MNPLACDCADGGLMLDTAELDITGVAMAWVGVVEAVLGAGSTG